MGKCDLPRISKPDKQHWWHGDLRWAHTRLAEDAGVVLLRAIRKRLREVVHMKKDDY